MTEKKRLRNIFSVQKHFIEVAERWGDEVCSLIPWKMSAGYAKAVGMATGLYNHTDAGPKPDGGD